MVWFNKKVLVCGGAGMIGSHLAKALISRDAKVTVVDDLSSGSIKNLQGTLADIRFVKADLRDLHTCEKLVKGKDVVFQLAADMGGIGYITSHFSTLMINNNLINTNVLRAAHKYNISNYFYSSSACVYPNFKQTEVDVRGLKEADAFPADPNEPYGWEKLYNEKLVECFQIDYKMNIHVARFHNVFGSAFTAFDKQKAKAPCKMIIDALHKGNIEIWNDGKQTRSFLYIDDCVEAVLRLMASSHTSPLNIGSERLVSMHELANIVTKISDRPIGRIYFPNKPQGVRGRNSDNTLVREVLKWEPLVPLEKGLQTTFEWAKENLDELEGV